MAQVHDPTYDVRRVLWLAYGVLAVGLILFIVAIVMIRQGAPNFFPSRPPTAVAPSSSPTATPSPSAEATPSPSAAAGGQAQAGRTGAAPSGSSGQLPSTGPGPRPGEPPGDVEDDTLINPSAASLPQLPVPVPSLPSALPSPPIH